MNLNFDFSLPQFHQPGNVEKSATHALHADVLPSTLVLEAREDLQAYGHEEIEVGQKARSTGALRFALVLQFVELQLTGRAATAVEIFVDGGRGGTPKLTAFTVILSGNVGDDAAQVRFLRAIAPSCF